MTQRPNILVWMSDEHDAAVTGCYGYPAVRTPHLNRLAGQGAIRYHGPRRRAEAGEL